MRANYFKYIFLGLAVVAAIGSWFYTLSLVKELSESERQRVKLWSEAYKEIQRVDVNQQISPLVLDIIESNTYIPVILCDENQRIIAFANLDSSRVSDSAYLYRQLEKMKSAYEPIVIDLGDGMKNYLYYKDSKVLTALYYYPFFQLLVVIIFVFVVYVAARTTKEAEEHYLWVAMSKETAHQLGTPLSSLIAWVEMLKMSDLDQRLIHEVEKDIHRLEIITERFSKIGATPELNPTDLRQVIDDVVSYLRRRSPRKINFKVVYQTDKPVIVKLNAPLFEWVIENLAKNAIDAMEGKGTIEINVKETEKNVIIDFKDQGRGIQARNSRVIFQPGYTTKKYGWGMGLALVKRIVENYHKGKIFVHSTSPKGTTFRIILNK